MSPLNHALVDKQNVCKTDFVVVVGWVEVTKPNLRNPIFVSQSALTAQKKLRNSAQTVMLKETRSKSCTQRAVLRET